MAKGTKKSFFDVMYSAPMELIKEFKKGSTKRKLKRKFESAHDNALDGVIELQAKIKEQLEKLGDLDLDIIQKSYLDIQKHKANMEMITTIYEGMFGETMRDVAGMEEDLFEAPKE